MCSFEPGGDARRGAWVEQRDSRVTRAPFRPCRDEYAADEVNDLEAVVSGATQVRTTGLGAEGGHDGGAGGGGSWCDYGVRCRGADVAVDTAAKETEEDA